MSPAFGVRDPENMHFDPEIEKDMRSSYCFYQNQEQVVIIDKTDDGLSESAYHEMDRRINMQPQSGYQHQYAA